MLAKLREFWPELAFAAFMGLFLLVRAKDGALFVGFCVFIAGLGWVAGYRHRSLSLHDKVDRMTDGVGEMLTEMRGETPAAPQPQLRLIRGNDNRGHGNPA